MAKEDMLVLSNLIDEVLPNGGFRFLLTMLTE